MRAKHIVLGVAFATSVAALGIATKADAQDSIYIPLLTYRTGPFAGSGIPIANGMYDYLAMLNERDGGINGVKIVIEECETGYDTKKGVECYEQVKGKKPVIMNPWSTGITLQLIPKASVDKIPILSMAYGLSAAAVGNEFPWVFNPPATYWDGLSMIFRYIGGKEGGLDKLKGKTIGYIFFDGGYGREPIPLLEQLAKDYGFTVKLYPVPPAEMQNQSALWLNVRRDRPSWMVMWGWGAMNPTAVKEAAQDQLSDGSSRRRLVVGWRGRRAASRTGRQGLCHPQLQRRRQQLSDHPGHHQVHRGQGQEPGRQD